MLKINRNTNFDPTDIDSIFDTSMYGDYDFTLDLNNDIDNCEFNNTELVRKAWIKQQIKDLLLELNTYRDEGTWNYNQFRINKIVDELKSYGIEIVERKRLKKIYKINI